MSENPSPKQVLDRERLEILRQLEDWLDLPMLVLSFVWLALFIIELIWQLTPLLTALSTVIWVLFVLDFGVEFLLAPRKREYLRRNWLGALSLLLPALRVFRSLQTVRAIRSVRLVQVMTRTNRGMQALADSVRRRGFGYVVALTAIVTTIGAAAMYTFEGDVPNTGMPDYGTALWWTAMLMTTMGSDYLPQTAEGRILCFLLALYAFAMFGYVTATLASFFVGQDAADPDTEIASAGAIADLHAEIAALRAEIQALISRPEEP